MLDSVEDVSKSENRSHGFKTVALILKFENKLA